MKKLIPFFAIIILTPFLTNAQNVGVDVAVPIQKLDVAGGIKIGTTATGGAGSIRWNGANIQYHDGTSWVNLIANTDDQNLTLTVNNLTIEDGNTIDLSPFLDNTDAQTLSLSGTDLTISTGNTVDLDPLRRLLVDADDDTKIQVEELPDEDIIRFDVAGSERWVMRGATLESIGTGGSIFIGENAGAADDLSNENVFIGENAGTANVTGFRNVAIGKGALESITGSNANIAIGYNVFQANASSGSNVAVGNFISQIATSGSQNVILGHQARAASTGGSNNVQLGARSGFNNNGSSNVFIGFQAGYNESGSNKLYVDNSNTATPLLYGDFATDLLRVNGTLNINSAYSFPTVDGAGSGYVMTTDGAGTISWTNPTLTGDITSIIAGDGLTTPGGLSGDVTIDVNPDDITIEVAAD